MSKAYPEGWTVLGPFRKLNRRYVGCCKECKEDLMKGVGMIELSEASKLAVDAVTRTEMP